MTKSFGLTISALLLVGIFSSCNTSRFPIDEKPVVKIDKRLIGKWRPESRKERKLRYTFSPSGEYKYTVQMSERRRRSKSEKFECFLSIVDDASFLNCYSKRDSELAYLFIKILNIDSLSNRLTLSAVGDTIMDKLNSSAAVRATIKMNLNNPSFYGDTFSLRKVK